MMKLSLSPMVTIATGLLSTATLSLATFVNLPAAQANDDSLTGVVERVWEDGFRLRVGDRSITTDTWAVCGDSTRQHVRVDDRLTVTGEFEFGEFDVFAIVDEAGQEVCQ
ncbi:MAG: hypothetical protein R6U67_13775 [Sodalinema sp.]|uniref:hypothetical protein n=1 Tax=Sodalinema sp. TaxID=3080550 RepID=UPI00396F54E5